jgi:hypothetical protein
MKVKSKKLKSEKGITLFIAIVIMSILLFISFAVVNITIKGNLFASSGRDSQLAFFAADSGIECDLYWDSKVNPSAFSIGTPATWAVTMAVEYSGVDTTSPLDKFSFGEGFASGNPNQVVSSGLVNTNFPNELIVGQGASEHTVTVPGAGFDSVFSLAGLLIEDKFVTTQGSYDAKFVLTNAPANAEWGSVMASFKAAAGKTPAVVNTAGAANTPGTARTVSFGNPSSNGDLIIVAFAYDTSDFNLTSITDNKGNTYTKVAGYMSAAKPQSGELWYAKNITNTNPDGSSGSGVPITITANSPAFVPQDIDCNGQHITAGLGSTNDVGTNPPQPHRIGGGGIDHPTSIFQLNFSNSTCAIERITKNLDGTTHIESRGYNTCNTSNSRRVERGVEVTY